MSPKPVNVPRALETLREERPSAEATESLLRALRQPAPRRSIARPLAFGLMAAALAMALFYPPHTKAGSAWAQTLANSLDVPATYSVSRNAKGELDGEYWVAGPKSATVLYRKGKPIIEMRGDGKRRFNLVDWGGWGGPPAANARVYGMVSQDWHMPSQWEVSYASLDALLKRPGLKVLSHEAAKDGQPEKYRLSVKTGRTFEIVAEIDQSVRRVAAVVEPKSGARTTIEYPSSIPDSVFEPRAQARAGVETYSSDELASQVQRTVRKGLGKRGPVNLRVVLLDANGALWAFWTGALPDPALSHPFSLPGVPCGPAVTNRVYTTGWRSSPRMNGIASGSEGPRVGGMARVPKVKLGSTVDIDVPYTGGVARFRKVPIIRIGLIQNLGTVFGVTRDYRG
jgi:hypothetical protein